MPNNGNDSVYKAVTFMVGVIIFALLGFMGNGIVANDRARASEDKEIRQQINDVKENFQKDVSDIKGDLREIKTLIEVLAKKTP